jgi:hypothetical protein
MVVRGVGANTASAELPDRVRLSFDMAGALIIVSELNCLKVRYAAFDINAPTCFDDVADTYAYLMKRGDPFLFLRREIDAFLKTNSLAWHMVHGVCAAHPICLKARNAVFLFDTVQVDTDLDETCFEARYRTRSDGRPFRTVCAKGRAADILSCVCGWMANPPSSD